MANKGLASRHETAQANLYRFAFNHRFL